MEIDDVIFSAAFMDSLNPESDEDEDATPKISNEKFVMETTRFESCVGEQCHEKQFIVGSAGTGNVGPLTYCADCYPNVSKAVISNAGECEKVPDTIVVDLIHIDENQKQETNALLQKNYGSENDDGSPFCNSKLLLDHLSVVNTIDDL